jgi:hypothetical protein
MPFLPHPRLMTMLAEQRRIAVLAEVDRLRREASARTGRAASPEGCRYCRRGHDGVDGVAGGRRDGYAGVAAAG